MNQKTIFIPSGMSRAFKKFLKNCLNVTPASFDDRILAQCNGLEAYIVNLFDAYMVFEEQVPAIFEGDIFGIPRFVIKDYNLGKITHKEFLTILEIQRKIMHKIPLINFNSTNKRKEIIAFYVDIFEEIPSASHLVRAFAQMEKQIIEMMERKELELTTEVEKLISKFDKIKSLAFNKSNTENSSRSESESNINERKAAFHMALNIWERITGIQLEREK
jgi:hypothetical protein